MGISPTQWRCKTHQKLQTLQIGDHHQPHDRLKAMVGSQFLLVDVGANGWLFGASLNLLGTPDGMAIPPCNGTPKIRRSSGCHQGRLSGDLDSSTLDVFQHDHHLVASWILQLIFGSLTLDTLLTKSDWLVDLASNLVTGWWCHPGDC